MYCHLTSLSSKLSNHEFKLTIIHYLTYFEEFQTACETFFKLQDSIKKREISPSEFATKKRFQDVNPQHEIYVLSSIFFNKIGKFQETEHIFRLIGFEPDNKQVPQIYSAAKNKTNYT